MARRAARLQLPAYSCRRHCPAPRYRNRSPGSSRPPAGSHIHGTRPTIFTAIVSPEQYCRLTKISHVNNDRTAPPSLLCNPHPSYQRPSREVRVSCRQMQVINAERTVMILPQHRQRSYRNRETRVSRKLSAFIRRMVGFIRRHPAQESSAPG